MRIRNTIIIVALTFIASLPISPAIAEQGRDSGVFAYVGAALLRGEVLFRDVADHTLIAYYINTAAFALFGENRWAIWWISLIFVAASALLLNHLLERQELPHRWSAIVLFIILARHPGLGGDGNFTETYALLPQFMILVLGCQLLHRPQHHIAFLLGCVIWLAVFIRQLTISEAVMLLPAAILIRHPGFRQRDWWHYALTTVMTGLGLTLGWVALQFIQGTWDSAWELLWTFKTIYPSTGQTNIFDVGNGRQILLPFLPLVLLGILLSLWRWRHQTATTFEIWISLAMLLSLFTFNLSQRGYEHYTIMLLPEGVLLIALALNAVKYPLLRFAVEMFTVLFALMNLLLMVLPPMVASNFQVFGPARLHPMVEYIQINTPSNQPIMVWGCSSLINFQSLRSTPAYFPCGYFYDIPGFTTSDHIIDLTERMRAAEPILIIHMEISDGMPRLDLSEAEQQAYPLLRPLFDYVAERCTAEAPAYGVIPIFRCG